MNQEYLVQKIKELKEARKAVVLAHNYQPPEIQDIADFVGDSLELSRQAAQARAEVIVFCGVHFMAETAAILSPEKTVLLPDLNAGCPMAEMIEPEDLLLLKQKHPNLPVVAYVNTTAKTKALVDICCTSANAVQIVNSLKAEEVIFVPDRYLAHYVSSFTSKKIHPWKGFCPTHALISPEEVKALKEAHPEAEVVVHPECLPEVVDLADKVASTTGICRYVAESRNREFIIGTEVGILHRLKKENPGKIFYPASEKAVCPNMKKITLEKLLITLEEMEPIVFVEEKIRIQALKAINQMLKVK